MGTKKENMSGTSGVIYGLGFVGAVFLYFYSHQFLDGHSRLLKSHYLAGLPGVPTISIFGSLNYKLLLIPSQVGFVAL